MKKIIPLVFIITWATACVAIGVGSMPAGQSTPQHWAASTFAGTAGTTGTTNATGGAALFNNPQGVAVDLAGNCFVADTQNHVIRKITSSAVVTTLAGIMGTSGSANGTGTAASFKQPQAVAVDSAGNVYVADTGNNLIRKITSAGVVTTLAGSGAGGNANNANPLLATFNAPQGVAADSSGNIYVADTMSFLIRKISASGVSTLAGSGVQGSADGSGTAASFNKPQGVATDPAGNIYIADTVNATIRKITSGGTVTTVAGTAGTAGATDGPGNAALFNLPTGLAVDSSGNIYVADSQNSTIRYITSAGAVSTIAGKAGTAGALDSFGTSSLFNMPSSVAFNSSGVLFIADTANFTIRKLTY